MRSKRYNLAWHRLFDAAIDELSLNGKTERFTKLRDKAMYVLEKFVEYYKKENR